MDNEKLRLGNLYKGRINDLKNLHDDLNEAIEKLTTSGEVCYLQLVHAESDYQLKVEPTIINLPYQFTPIDIPELLKQYTKHIEEALEKEQNNFDKL